MKKQTLGLLLILLSIVFFGIFIWWGTTTYKVEFATGIVLVAVGTFLTGCIMFQNGGEDAKLIENQYEKILELKNKLNENILIP